ncbi:V-type ATP synthase subunit I [Clostridium botulinum]|uniref:ATP synthase subunit I n=2 Tax=Clostridium botulinum TaxID=1491 RepID=A0A0A0IPR8_CLOBO|nr:V-type ATP synthase subunit I [Clostridium botulinum]KEI04638.1 ATP synthase subunit I [Clostridium botulinum C/D str. BKT75002]KEI06091.1 ATP synthase subunit I [Clostridium botulinum C/D str. BKT2873]KGM93704.1 ATP synthase subunit I [Clostridium botulinum D str. CCUG 7971]KGN01491.1 ATP synthase subunit I [Clostridium botulinum C/D str. DC5]KOC49810.1 ATP synthase subunit I [Clostridium botulinum]
MAIVKMNKFTLFAFEKEKKELLRSLQEFEGVQFIDLKPNLKNEEMSFFRLVASDKDILELEGQLSKIKFCLDYLKPYFERKGAFSVLKEGKKTITFKELENIAKEVDWNIIYQELKLRENRINNLNNEKTKIETDIENILPWENFDGDFGELDELKLTTYFLGTIPTSLKNKFLEEIKNSNEKFYFETINETSEELYVLIIGLKEQEDNINNILKTFGFSKINVKYNGNPNKTIVSLKEKLGNIDREKENIFNELRKFKEFEEQLQVVYEYYSNELFREKEEDKFLRSDNVIVIQGWNTISSNEVLEVIVKNISKNSYYLAFEDNVEEDVPIKLKNNNFVEPFESITEMYSLPQYTEIDPTPIMSIFYFIFFGMMLSDAGYGLIMIIGTLIALKLFKLDKGMKNFMKLFLYLGISTTIWGAIYGGWFGDASAQFVGKVAPYILSPSTQIMAVLGLAVVFGVIHIFVGLGMKAYVLLKKGKVLDAIYDVGLWYISLIGIFLMIAGIGGAVGKIMMIVGFVGLILTQGRDADTFVGKLGGGLYGLYGITGYIGDIVSYSRLLALGLATGFIANAFNLMINLIPAPVKYFVGPIIFVGGHLFNLGVNALGAYVHSSRLQYLEFFNKFYEGGGKVFTPFKSVSKFMVVTNEEININRK